MGSSYDWNTIFRQLYTQLLWQSEKLGQMQKQLEQISTELQALQRQKPVNVEKIEYNFDQLKVEKLDGTLNIGITPDNVKSIEQFAVGNNFAADGSFVGPGPAGAADPLGPFGPPGAQEAFSAIKGGVKKYLSNDVVQDMKVLEGKYGTPLADEYRAHIVADLSKQVDDRITHYILKYDVQDDGDQRNEQESSIMEQVENDIKSGIESYLQTFPKKEME